MMQKNCYFVCALGEDEDTEGEFTTPWGHALGLLGGNLWCNSLHQD